MKPLKHQRAKGYRPHTGRDHGWQVVAAILCFLIMAVIIIIRMTMVG